MENILSRNKILVAILLLIPVFFWGYALWDDAVYTGPRVTDQAAHVNMTRTVRDAWAQGRLGLDAWYDSCCLGAASYRTYQNLAHELAAGVSVLMGQRDPAGAVSLLSVIALATHCLFFYFAARLFGVSRVVSLLVSWLSPLVSCGIRLGHEFPSYVFAGLGAYTQALAMGPFVMALAASARAVGAVEPGSEISGPSFQSAVRAGLWIGLTFLLHHLYGAMAIVGMGLFAVSSLVFGWAKSRQVITAGVVSAAVFLVFASHQILSILQDAPLAYDTIRNSPLRKEGYGALVFNYVGTGKFFDWQRWPIFSLLTALGFGLSLRRASRREEKALLLLFVFSICLLAGRTFFGSALKMVPIPPQLPLERFTGPAQCAAIFLAALGMEFLLFGQKRLPGLPPWSKDLFRIVGVCVAIFSMTYLMRERHAYLSVNSLKLSEQREDNTYLDPEFMSTLAPSLAGGRFWAPKFAVKIGYVPLGTVVGDRGFSQVSIGEHSLTYVSDTVYGLEKYKRPLYRLFNITGVALPDGTVPDKSLTFLKRVQEVDLYRTSSNGYWDVVGLTEVEIVDTEKDFVTKTEEWLKSDRPERSLHPAYVPRKIAERWPESIPSVSSTKSDSWGEVIESTPLKDGGSRAVLSASEGAYAVLKTAYHPRWKVEVNGNQVAPKWVAPGFVAFPLAKGRSEVKVQFPTDPLRSSLFVLFLILWSLWMAVSLADIFSERKLTAFLYRCSRRITKRFALRGFTSSGSAL